MLRFLPLLFLVAHSAAFPASLQGGGLLESMVDPIDPEPVGNPSDILISNPEQQQQRDNSDLDTDYRDLDADYVDDHGDDERRSVGGGYGYDGLTETQREISDVLASTRVASRLTSESLARAVLNVEGFSISAWLREQAGNVERMIKQVAKAAEELADRGLESIKNSMNEFRSALGKLKEKIVELSKKAVDAIDVTKEELEAQERAVKAARERFYALLSDEEKAIEKEGREAEAKVRPKIPANQMQGKKKTAQIELLELARSLPAGHVEEEMSKRSGAHWRWAEKRLAEMHAREQAYPGVHGRTDLLVSEKDNARFFGAPDPCGCKTSGSRLGKYDPDAWGSQCRDWDSSGYNWCYINNGSKCSKYTVNASKAHRGQYWRKCGVSVWAKATVKETVSTAKAVYREGKEVGRQLVEDVVEVAQPHVDRIAEAAQPHVDRVIDAVQPHVDRVVDAVQPHIDNAVEIYREVRREASDRLDALTDKVVAGFEEWQRNAGKREALRDLAAEAVKFQAMSFAYNTGIVIGQAVDFIKNEGAQMARDAIPDLVVVGVNGGVNVGVLGREVVWDLATLQRMQFTYAGVDVGTKLAEVASAGVAIGVGWKGNTENDPISDAYKGAFVSLSAGAGPSIGIASLGIGGLFAVSASDNFVPIPTAVKTFSITGGASVGAEIPFIDFSANVGFTKYEAVRPGRCYGSRDEAVLKLLFDFVLPDTLSRLMGAIGMYAREPLTPMLKRNVPGECKSD